ncbi:MAG TPA: hypothetical protein VK808_01420, partial [Bacteroidia bacterium]|nr:hypothetical protein [Bacteroidia bacterium]
KINVEYQNQMASYNKVSSRFTPEEQQSTLKQINARRDDELKNVLTIAQTELFKKMHPDK